jgi:ketosteroid isomerase-like protein
VYHAIVRRRTGAMFDLLSTGRWSEIADQLADGVHHGFPGDHPLGGERHSREAVTRWFERLGRLYPGHQFEVHNVVSRGWPWSTWVAVQWSARLTPAQGQAYTNHGTHWIHLSWGKASSFHAYLDTQLIERSCSEMVAAGVEEAGAGPITDR